MTSALRFCSLLLLSWCVAHAQFSAVYAPIPADTRLERDLLTLTNQARQRAGLSTLLPDEALSLAARQHAQEMVDLNYFSHSSPVARNASLGQRVAQAGSAAQGVGENLALVGPQEVAQQSVQGWMESPGHRENLLTPSYTHVGFGATQDARGRVYVAQVFAEQPLAVERVQVTSRLQEGYRAEVELTLSEAKEVTLFYGTSSLPAQVLGAGRHALGFNLADAAQIHLQVGVRDPGETSGFILHDDGWLDSDGRWQPSGIAPRQLAQIEGVSRRLQISRVYRADFTFETVPERTLGGWLDGVYFEPQVEGRNLTVLIPSDLENPTLELGMQTSSGRYALLYRLRLELNGGAPQLAPVLPGTLN